MAQYFLSAADAGALAKFTQIHGSTALEIVDDGGTPAFRIREPYASYAWTELGQMADAEIVIKIRHSSSTGGSLYGGSAARIATNRKSYQDQIYYDGIGLSRFDPGGRQNLALTGNPGNAIKPEGASVYHLRRFQIVGTTLRSRIWKPGDTEPTSWQATATDSVYTSGYVGLTGGLVTSDSYVAWIGVGTDGDPAPTAPVGPTDPQLPVNIEQTPEVASSLSIAGTIFTPLSATIEQQARVRGFSNELSSQIYGIYNPGTEADGPLDWPYVYSPTQNEIVLQAGRFVGTTDLAATNSYMEVPLAEIGTGPFTDYGVVGKTHSRAETRFQGLRFGFTDSVSGAYAYVEVWDKNWYLEFYDGVSNGGSDSGTLEFPVNDISLSYSTNINRFLLYINNSGASNSLEQAGLSFDSAFYQVNNGGESVSWFEELATVTLPSNYSPATVYIPGSDSTIESASSAQASLQLGTGRRLAATVEQDSALLATAGQALPLSTTVAQDSSFASNLRQALPLASTLVQGSALQSNLTLGLPLAATVAQDSSLLAGATIGLPLAATSETQTQVLGSATVALSLSSTLATGSSLQGPLRLGSGLQATLSQASSLQASLGLGLRLSATAVQGSTVLGQMAASVRLSGLVAQGSSLEGTSRIGAGLAADVYTDSAVSAALGVAVRLSGTVGQANADMAITGPRIGLPLYATVATPADTGATLQKQAGLALQSTLSQGSALPAALSGGTTGGSSAIIEQGSEAIIRLRTPVRIAPSLVEQAADTTVSLAVSIPLGAADLAQASSLAPRLVTTVRLFGLSDQFSEVDAPAPRTDKRLSALLEQQTDFELPLDGFGFADALSTLVESEGQTLSSLKVSVRLSASAQTGSSLQALAAATRALPTATLAQASNLYLVLRTPAVGSTGWLTVSDIVFHNDYYSEVVFERLPASEIAIMPAVRLDSLSIKPE